MTLIKVDPSLLQLSGQDIQGSAQNIFSVGSNVLGAAQSAPSYNGQFGPQVSAIGQDAYSRLGGISNQLNDLGARLTLKGAEFQSVNSNSIDQFQATISTTEILDDPAANLSSLPTDQMESYLRCGSLITEGSGDLIQGGARAVIAGNIHLGDTYDGELIIPGNHELKDLAGIDEHLTNIGGDNLPENLANSALEDATDFDLGSVSGALYVAGIAMDVGADYYKYQGQGTTKMVSAMAVDTALDVAETAVGGYAGEYIGAALGTALIPIPGVGTIIGGFLGQIAGVWVAREIGTNLIRGSAIDAVSNFLSQL